MNYHDKIYEITPAQESGSSDYASTVRVLVDNYVSGNIGEESFAPLLSLLGCRTVRYESDGVEQRFDEPEQPDSEHEELVTKTLLTLLRKTMENNTGDDPHDAFSLLDGFARNNRWRACLETRTAANELAVLLLDASMTLGCFTDGSPIYALVLPGFSSLYAMLNEWVKPAQPFTEKTAMAEIACTLFGNVWYDLTFGSESWFNWPMSNGFNNINRAIIVSIHQTQPPFQPGLLGAGAGEQERVELPGLEPA
jgi:hypothetical protein